MGSSAIAPRPLLFSSSHAWPIGSNLPAPPPSQRFDWASAGLQRGVGLLGLGATRFPGGTGSDCWDWSSNATSPALPNYLPNCLTTAKTRHRVAAQGSNFTLGRWRATMAPRFRAGAEHTVYVLNMYSASATAAGSVVGLVESLAAQQPPGGAPVRYLEMGNELYCKGKRDRLTNASAYLQAVAPAAARAHALWPGVQVAISVDCLDLYNATTPAAAAGAPPQKWNAQLVKAFAAWPASQRALVSAVACHDYTLKYDSLALAAADGARRPGEQGAAGEPDYASLVGAWPEASVSNSMRELTRMFAGAGATAPADVWQTESGIPFFGFGKAAPANSGQQRAFDFLNTTVKLGVLQAMNSIGFVLRGIALGDGDSGGGRMSMYHHPCLFSFAGVNNCGDDASPFGGGALLRVGTGDAVTCSAAAQVLAAASAAANAEGVTAWQAAAVEGGTVGLLGRDVPCGQGATFFGAGVVNALYVNRCSNATRAALDVGAAALARGHAAGAPNVTAFTFALADDGGHPSARVAQCDAGAGFPWAGGPMAPRRVAVTGNASKLWVPLPPHSVVVVLGRVSGRT
jgi:hypothetical protein